MHDTGGIFVSFLSKCLHVLKPEFTYDSKYAPKVCDMVVSFLSCAIEGLEGVFFAAAARPAILSQVWRRYLPLPNGFSLDRCQFLNIEA